MFRTPHAIDVKATVAHEAPAAWRKAGSPEKVDVLPLAAKADAQPGWCTAPNGLDGPEVEVLCGGINTKSAQHAALWRQGNLVHFGFQEAPSQLNGAGRALLANAIAYAARFCSDRPLVRVKSFTAPAGDDPFVSSGLPAKAEPFDVAIADRAVFATLIATLPERTTTGGGERADAARALLAKLLPEAGEAKSPQNWRNWLKGRDDALFFDTSAKLWRIDWLAYRRGQPSAELRGAARADGAGREPKAVALAEKVAAAHGGARALDDLQTFRCRRGELHFLWDRRSGRFRAENHGAPPVGRGTHWKVAVFDVAADADLIRGGGPEPRPYVSAQGMYRHMLESLFLPLLLAEPVTSLRLLEEGAGAAAEVQLEALLAGRTADPKERFVLDVDPATGAVHAIKAVAHDGRRTPPRMLVAARFDVGPLHLTDLRPEVGDHGIPFSDPQWNPHVPAGAWTSTELLLAPK